jgi:MGT family glycosyltransferase
VKQQQGVSLRNFLDYARASAKMFCEEAPGALESAAVDGVVVDMAQPGGSTAAELIGLPFVTVCNALPLNSEPDVPPDFLPWQYRDASVARTRNRLAYGLRNLMISPLHRVINRYRAKRALRPYRSPDDSFSPFAQITQLVPEFDLPRKRLPHCFHFVGPYRRDPERNIPFPYEHLDGSPLIYASLGTVFSHRIEIWNAIVEGCSNLNAQLVLCFGGQRPTELICHLPPNAIVVDYAPQRELLGRASLAIIHAGLNSAMESIAAGVPMIAIPITGDQFGVAARIAHAGIGEIVPAAKCTASRIRAAARKILSSDAYRERECAIRAAINRTSGAVDAAAIIEEVITTCRPVSRHGVFVG